MSIRIRPEGCLKEACEYVKNAPILRLHRPLITADKLFESVVGRANQAASHRRKRTLDRLSQMGLGKCSENAWKVQRNWAVMTLGCGEGQPEAVADPSHCV